MSNEVFSLAKKRVIGSATTKAVLLLMADSASDDGGGVWISKANISRDLELSKRAVQLAVGQLIEAGIIAEVGQKPCRHGFTVEYRIVLEALAALPSTREPHSPLTGEPDARVNVVHPMGRTTFTPTREPRSPKPSLEPSLEPSICLEGDLFGKQAAAEKPKADDLFSDFWAVYPKKVGKAAALKNWNKAMKSGASPSEIIAAAKVYADHTAGKDAAYIKNPEGWITARRWEDEDLRPAPIPTGETLAQRRDRLLMRGQFGEVLR